MRMTAREMLARSLTRSGRPDDSVDGRFQSFHLHWLDQMLGKSGFEAFLDVAIHAKAADGDSGNAGNRAQPGHEFGAGAIGKRDIADEKIETIAHRSFHGRANIVGSGHKMSAADEQSFQSDAGVLMIVYQ